MERKNSSTKQAGFAPFPGLRSGWLQTILGAKLNYPSFANSKLGFFTSPDGDQLSYAQSQHIDWEPQDPTIVLLHGLCGSHKASYIQRLSKRLLNHKYRVVGLNFRGCGPMAHLAKGLAHSGRSEDLLALIQHLRQETPASSMHIVGFSLGGNVALKLAGELSTKEQQCIQSIVAICPPVDLARCANLMEEKSNWVFRRYFIKRLNKIIRARHHHHPELGPVPKFPLNTGFWHFDDAYTAPHSGFTSAKDYYERNSTIYRLQNIQAVPCKLILAKDDPFIDYRGVLDQSLPSNIELVITENGGHLGFLSHPIRNKTWRWLDQVIESWALSQTR